MPTSVTSPSGAGSEMVMPSPADSHTGADSEVAPSGISVKPSPPSTAAPSPQPSHSAQQPASEGVSEVATPTTQSRRSSSANDTNAEGPTRQQQQQQQQQQPPQPQAPANAAQPGPPVVTQPAGPAPLPPTITQPSAQQHMIQPVTALPTITQPGSTQLPATQPSITHPIAAYTPGGIPRAHTAIATPPVDSSSQAQSQPQTQQGPQPAPPPDQPPLPQSARQPQTAIAPQPAPVAPRPAPGASTIPGAGGEALGKAAATTANGANGSAESEGSETGDTSPQRQKPGPAQIQVRPGVTVCQNCLTTTTPLWRRDENGQIMCNACGLFLKLHGRRRPISLKTDMIKSRNRSNRQNRQNQRPAPKRRNVQMMGVSTTDGQPDGDYVQYKHPQTQQVHSQSLKGQAGQQQDQNAQSHHVHTQPASTKDQARKASSHTPQPPQGSASRPQMLPAQMTPHIQNQVQQQIQAQLPGAQLPTSQLSQQGVPLPQGLHLGIPGMGPMQPMQVMYPTSPALSPYVSGTPGGMILNSPVLAPLGSAVMPGRVAAPMSPQIAAQLGQQATPGSARGAMSEQLLPRSPESVERIPQLPQVPVAQFQQKTQLQQQQPQQSQRPSQSPESRREVPWSSDRDANTSQEEPQPSRLALLTRVSELELVNDLLRRRVQDLETSESESRSIIDGLKLQLAREREPAPQAATQTPSSSSATPHPATASPTQSASTQKQNRGQQDLPKPVEPMASAAPAPQVKRIKVSELI